MTKQWYSGRPTSKSRMYLITGNLFDSKDV